MDQIYFTTLSLVVSFLGGGVIGALVNYVRSERSEKKQRQIKFVDEQIRNLYGPLYYFVSQNEKLFELSERYHIAYRKEFIDQKWSRDDRTRENLSKRAETTIDLANKYVEEVLDNNTAIKAILDKQYSYIDPDDVEIFILFYEHHIRYRIEINEEGKLVTPDGIYDQIGDLSFMRPEFATRVKEKFASKKSELAALIKN